MAATWVPWLTILGGIAVITFSRRLARDAIRQRLGTRFIPPEVVFLAERRKLEEERYRRVFIAGGLIMVLAGSWILARIYLGL
jgi:hypothetical protein